jgi:hypothetical protein
MYIYYMHGNGRVANECDTVVLRDMKRRDIKPFLLEKISKL